MKPRFDIAVGLLLLQVLGSWGLRISSYRSSYRSSYYSSYYRSSSSYSSSSNYDNSYIGDMPFPQWAKNPKGAAALYIFYNLTDEGPPYRDTFLTLTSGQFCVNNQGFIFDNVSYSMGRFQCPVDGFTTDDVYCCGSDPFQYCCQLMDDPGRRSLIIVLPILSGLVIAIVIGHAVRVYTMKRRKHAAASMSAQASSMPASLQMGMGPVPGYGFAPSSVLPPPPPPQAPFTINSAHGYSDAPPPPPLLYASNAPIPPPEGEASPGFGYSYTSPREEKPTDSAPPSYEEVSHVHSPYLLKLSPHP